jgi:hypothetical protein
MTFATCSLFIYEIPVNAPYGWQHNALRIPKYKEQFCTLCPYRDKCPATDNPGRLLKALLEEL